MNKYGPYFQIPGSGEDILDAWPGCPAALFMDVDGDFIARLRTKYPDLKIIVRVCEPSGQGWRDIPAHRWAQVMLDRFNGNNPDFVIAWTMPCGQDDDHLFAELDQWHVDFAEAIRPYGIEPIGLCFSTGNFTARDDRTKIPDAFPKTCSHYNVLGPQCYDWPDLRRDPQGHALRFVAWHDDIQAATGKDMQFIVTECGLTQAVHEGRPDRGWRDKVPDAPTDDEYVDTMSWFNSQLAQLEYVKYALVYIFYDYNWDTFRHHDKPEVWHKIRDLEAETPPEQPPGQEPEQPPSGGYGMDIKVIDLEYKERDFEYAEDKYGVAFRRAQVEPGQRVYRLVELREKTGSHALVTTVLKEDGSPLHNADVSFYWPDAPDPPDPPTTVYTHDWYRNFVHGFTNVNGDVGPGMGRGAYHGEGEGGPHAVWVRDPDIPSDICEKLGMLAGTNHDHLDQVVQVMVEGEGGGTTEPGELWYELDYKDEAHHPLGAAYILWPDDDDAYDTNARGGIVGGPELDVSDPVRVIRDGKRYAKSEMSTAGVYEGQRTFWIHIHRVDSNLTRLSGDQAATFTQGEQKAVYFVMKKSGAQPPQEPPSGEMGELFSQAATHCSVLAALTEEMTAHLDGLSDIFEALAGKA